MRSVLFLNLIICFLFVAVNNVHAFRCGTEPIGRTDSKAKVYKYCGNPTHRGHEKVFFEGRNIYAETWYYNCGEGDFVYAVSFYKDIVIKEEPKERGLGPSQCGK